MNRHTTGALLVIFCCLTTAADAIQPGKKVVWETPVGRVTFDGSNHRDAGIGCLECHSRIFKMKKGANAMTMADIHAGKFCGKCHNGKRAFATKDPDNCSNCHSKT